MLHDWGGIVCLRILHQHVDQVARVCLTNTGMFLRDPSEPMPEIVEPRGPFAAFQKMVRETPNWPHWKMLSAGCVAERPREVVEAYHAPYPAAKYLCAIVSSRRCWPPPPTIHNSPTTGRPGRPSSRSTDADDL